MEITGKVVAILPLQEGVSKQGKQWATQSFVLETLEQYPKKVCIEVFGQDKINDIFPSFGDVVTAQIDIDAREWNGKWFNQIRTWKVERK